MGIAVSIRCRGCNDLGCAPQAFPASVIAPLAASTNDTERQKAIDILTGQCIVTVCWKRGKFVFLKMEAHNEQKAPQTF